MNKIAEQVIFLITNDFFLGHNTSTIPWLSWIQCISPHSPSYLFLSDSAKLFNDKNLTVYDLQEKINIQLSLWHLSREARKLEHLIVSFASWQAVSI